MAIRLSLHKKWSATFININASTNLEEIKKQFYNDLINCVNWLRHKEVERGFQLSRSKKAQLKRKASTSSVFGEQSCGYKYHFKHKDSFINNRQMHPWIKHWRMLNYIIVKQRDADEVVNTKVMRESDSGLCYARSGMVIKRQLPHNMPGLKPLQDLSQVCRKIKKGENDDMKQNWKDLKEKCI